MDVLAAGRLGKAQRKLARLVGEAFGQKRPFRQVLKTKLNHVEGVVELVDAHQHPGLHIATRLGLDLHRQLAVAGKVVDPTHVALEAARPHHGADAAEIAGNLRLELADTDEAGGDVGGIQQHGHQGFELITELAHQLGTLDAIFLEDVAAYPANQVEAVGLACTGEQLGQGHGFFPHPEELHEAGVETGEVARQADVEDMAVQALHLQQHGADHLGPLRYHNTHGVLYRGGVGDAVGKAADAADPVGQKRHFVVAHAGFRQFFHAAMDIEEAVVGIDDVFAIDEQTKVARLVRGDVQRADRHDAVGITAELVDEGVGLGVGGGHRALAIIHGVLAQRVDILRPVVRQHQTAFVRQADGAQAVHVADLPLAPHRRRNGRGDGGVLLGIGIHQHLDGDPALGVALHGEDVVDGEVAVEAALVIGKRDREPASLLVEDQAGEGHQIGGLDGQGGLIGGLPLLVDDGVGQLLSQLLDIVATDAIRNGDGHAVLTLNSQMMKSKKAAVMAGMSYTPTR